MQMVKVFLKVLKQHSNMIIMYLVIFSALMVLSVYNMPKKNVDENTYYKLGYVNRDSSNAVNENLLEYLRGIFRTYEIKDDSEFIRDSIISYYYDYVLIIESDGSLKSFSRNDSAAKAVIDMKINEYMSTVEAVGNLNIPINSERINGILSKKINIAYTSENVFTDVGKIAVYGYYQYAAYIIMTIVFMIISIGYKNFSREKIARRLAVSGKPQSDINLKLFLATSITLFLVWILFNAIAIILFKDKILNSAGYKLMLNMLVFMIPTTALGFLITSLSRKISVQNAMANALSLVLSFISGIFVSAEYLPDGILKMSSLMPPYWYIRGMDAAMSGEKGSEYLMALGILVLIGLAIMSLKLIIDNGRYKSVGN